ncbi:MAG: class I SAM-dependent rRNA methyltransferase [Sulfuricellaceae bacterium]|jgi:23S rRNA (cytosine1962-C5)-methyltransferase
MSSLILKPGREKSLQRRHPWVFSGAIAKIKGEPQAGDTVEIRSAEGGFLGRGAYSPSSNIVARIWTWRESEAVDAAFFRRRLDAALSARRAVLPGEDSDALRLVYAESDGLPGFIVDRYGDTLVMQVGTAGAEAWRDTVADLLLELTGAKGIYERSDADVRELEGLPPRSAPLRGEPATATVIREHGLSLKVDIAHGHKTGFYLDQRANRARVGLLAKDREVLNCFSYSGGFTLHALAGGAKSVLSLDASGDALALGAENVRLNGLPEDRAQWLEGDAFKALRKFRDEGRKFDLVVLDPPKFAPTAAHAEKAARGYKDINLLGFKLLRPGGLLATFSCSGGIDAALFQKIVAGAALDAGVDATIVDFLHQGPDHPVSLAFPESAYLKGLICRVN